MERVTGGRTDGGAIREVEEDWTGVVIGGHHWGWEGRGIRVRAHVRWGCRVGSGEIGVGGRGKIQAGGGKP